MPKKSRHTQRSRDMPKCKRETTHDLAALCDQMPQLAGACLPAPNLHPVDWKDRQCFTSKQDPDRCQLPWTHESDLRDRDCPTTHSELRVPRGHSGRFARTIEGVLDQRECAELLESVNSKGALVGSLPAARQSVGRFTPALINIGNGVQQLSRASRDGNRVIVDSSEVAQWLLKRIRAHLPQHLPNGWQLAGLNERLRVLCYVPGQEFPPHQDGCYRRTNGDCSKVTVQLYLHDVPKEFGGATTFFPGRQHSVQHQPTAGSVLLFSQDLEHEGSLVKKGIKYAVRTEAMYRYTASPDVSGVRGDERKYTQWAEDAVHARESLTNASELCGAEAEERCDFCQSDDCAQMATADSHPFCDECYEEVLC